MYHSIKTKLEQFRLEIRRNDIQQYKQAKRKTIIECLEHSNLDQLSQIFNLPQRHTNQRYNFQEFLQEAYYQLLNPFQEHFKIVDDDQPCISIKHHITFWRYYAYNIQQDNGCYCEELGLFISKFLDKNSYKNVMINKQFQLQLFNLIELIAPLMEKSQRQKLLMWVEGTQSLRIIKSCLVDETFLRYNKYSNIYKIIELGLKTGQNNSHKLSAQLLTEILRHGDWQDTFSIYQSCYNIGLVLIELIEKYYRHEEVYDFGLALLSLLDTFDEAILDYARSGVVYIASLLLCDHAQFNQHFGIMLLSIISQLCNHKIIELFLTNIENTHFWTIICSQTRMAQHPNASIKKHYFSFLHNIFVNSNEQQTKRLLQKFDPIEDIAYLLEASLEQNNQFLTPKVLKIILHLLYYQPESQPYLIFNLLTKTKIFCLIEEIKKYWKAENILELAVQILNKADQCSTNKDFQM